MAVSMLGISEVARYGNTVYKIWSNDIISSGIWLSYIYIYIYNTTSLDSPMTYLNALFILVILPSLI